MKEAEKWKEINIKGLRNYIISILGEVRESRNMTYIHAGLNNKNKKCVSLDYYGRKKVFTIDELMFATFKSTQRDSMAHLSGELQMFNKPSQFSDNEEDYGKKQNRRHMDEIRQYLKRIRYINNHESD